MAQSLPENELVSFKELLMANSIQVDALAQLLIEEGQISQEKFIAKLKLKQVQAQYQAKENSKN
jgi:hypothetical protein